MNKEELLSRIDGMIQQELNHIEWLNNQRITGFGSFFWPKHNRLIDEYICKNTFYLNELKKSRIEYEKANFDY